MRVRLLTLLAVYAALFMNAAAVADEAVYQSSGEPRSVDEILLSLPGGRDAGIRCASVYASVDFFKIPHTRAYAWSGMSGLSECAAPGMSVRN